MSSTPVRNVSDTARWVAAYRAKESARRNALFHDPLAERLAGERGREIAKRAVVHSEWSLITRTKLIDDLVLRSVAEGTDCVLNLAAGFDTRPYRLELPSELSWIEVDLAELIDEKEAALCDESPRCRLTRERADLADAEARTALLRKVASGASKVTVITEGLVIYLEAAMVAELARAFAAEASLRQWIVDFSSPEILELMKQGLGNTLVNAPFRFAPAEGIGFFEREGWRAETTYSLLREAGRLRRLPLWMRPFAWLPQPNPRAGKGRWSVVVRFERA